MTYHSRLLNLEWTWFSSASHRARCESEEQRHGITSSAFLHQIGVRKTHGVMLNVPIHFFFFFMSSFLKRSVIKKKKKKISTSRVENFLEVISDAEFLQDCQRRWQQVMMDRLDVTFAHYSCFCVLLQECVAAVGRWGRGTNAWWTTSSPRTPK